MPQALASTADLGLNPTRAGKVRDVFDLGDRLLIVSTDRLSAYDVILPTRLPAKGVLLTQITLGWYEHFGSSLRTQGSQVLGQQLGDVKGRHVLLIDDILDSGGTLKLVKPQLESLGAATVKTAVLLRKDRPAAREVQADYVGFEIPDEFVVGYGLDYNNYYRNLPDIVTLNREAIERHA